VNKQQNILPYRERHSRYGEFLNCNPDKCHVDTQAVSHVIFRLWFSNAINELHKFVYSHPVVSSYFTIKNIIRCMDEWWNVSAMEFKPFGILNKKISSNKVHYYMYKWPYEKNMLCMWGHHYILFLYTKPYLDICQLNSVAHV